VERPQLTTSALKKDPQAPDNTLYHFFEIESFMGSVLEILAQAGGCHSSIQGGVQEHTEEENAIRHLFLHKVFCFHLCLHYTSLFSQQC
jgi:hypothetical protein